MTAPQPGPSVQEIAAQWKANAEYIRGQVRQLVPAPHSPPMLCRERLLAIRAQQDTLEELLVLAMAGAAGLRRVADDAKEAFDKAWAEEADKGNKASVRRGDDFQGPRERYASYDVTTFNLRRAWRQADQLAAVVEEALEEVRVRYRAVNDTRADLMAVIYAFRVESSLDRT